MLRKTSGFQPGSTSRLACHSLALRSSRSPDWPSEKTLTSPGSKMIRTTLGNAEEVVIVVAEHRAATEQAKIRGAGEAFQHRLHPGHRRLAVDAVTVVDAAARRYRIAPQAEIAFDPADRQFQDMSTDEQDRVRENFRRYQRMSIERRQQLRDRFRDMTPEQRQRLRDRAADRPRPSPRR